MRDLEITGLSVDRAPGRTLRAAFSLTTTGTARLTMRADVLAAGRTVDSRRSTLSGDTSYTRRVSYTFPERPCGTTVGIRVTVGAKTATRQVRVTCPPSVRSVEVLRAVVSGSGGESGGESRGRSAAVRGAAAGERIGASATVRVITGSTAPVRLSVALRLGGQTFRAGVTLSGETSYTTTVTLDAGKIPCGTAWQVTAATSPTAGNGSDTLTGRTAACPEPTEEPTEQPTRSRRSNRRGNRPASQKSRPRRRTPRSDDLRYRFVIYRRMWLPLIKLRSVCYGWGPRHTEETVYVRHAVSLASPRIHRDPRVGRRRRRAAW